MQVSCTELWVNRFDSKVNQICLDELPEMEDIVPADVVSLLYDMYLRAQKKSFHGKAKSTGTTTNNKYL